MAQTRYETVYETILWSRRLRDFTISTVAQVSSVSTNLVTVTNASSTVTSAGTPFTSAMVGRQIQVGADPQYFFVNSFTDTSNVVLGNGEATAVNWPGATASAQSWRVFQTIYTLPSTADLVLTLAGDYPIYEYDGGRTALDQHDPYRISTNATPTSWLYAGEDSSGVRELELWPVPSAAKLLRGQIARQAPTITSTSTIDIHVPSLVFGTTADCCNMLHAKTGDESWKHLGLFYERKVREVLGDVLPVEYSKLSLPTTLRKSKSLRRLVGTDFEVSHLLEGP